MIFNIGTCFGLTDAAKSRSGTPKSEGDSVETFQTIKEFLQRHDKLKIPVSSALHKVRLCVTALPRSPPFLTS